MKTDRKGNRVGTKRQRLGERLVSEALVKPEKLAEAVEYQCIYGGRLGTSLIELGLVDEEKMARMLSQQLRLHFIKPELLMHVSATVLKLVPKDIALKYQIVPYYKDDKKLYAAVPDPTNLKHLNELALQLNHIIVPLAIPEIRLLLALKKHYGLLLSPRYDTLAAQLQRRSMAARKKEQTSSHQHTEEATDQYLETDKPWPLLGDADLGDDDLNDIYLSSAASMQPDITECSPLNQLAEARSRDDIAAALIDHLKQDFPACGLFVVREDHADGWVANSAVAEAGFNQLVIPLNEDSICRQVVAIKSYYLGPIFATGQNSRILACFASKAPQQVLALPLLVQQRLVAILYLQGELPKLEERLTELQILVNKAEMSFTMLILRNKILKT